MQRERDREIQISTVQENKRTWNGHKGQCSHWSAKVVVGGALAWPNGYTPHSNLTTVRAGRWYVGSDDQGLSWSEGTVSEKGSLIPTGPFILFLILVSNCCTTILSGQKSQKHMVEKSSLRKVILKDEMSQAQKNFSTFTLSVFYTRYKWSKRVY